MRLVHKDGVQIMEIDKSADAGLIAMLKAQGWSEPSYYCKNCGEVPMSKGLCKCFSKREDFKMKYSIGDRVIVKESGERGIVVKIEDWGYHPGYGVHRIEVCWREMYHEHDLLTDLTAIEKPFGLLSKEVQEELKDVNNGKNIQLLEFNGWSNCIPAFENIFTYRLDPNWKAEEELSDAYLRIREIVGAWDTNKGGENRFEVTENLVKKAVSSEGLGVKAKKLKWKPVEPEIFHDEECYNANIEIVMCNEDKAYYEVARFRDRDLLYYEPSFWYGNQGGHMKYERYDTKEEAMLRCQEHYNSIIQENIVHEAQTKYKKELLDKAGER